MPSNFRMDADKTFYSEFRHRGHRVVIFEIPVVAAASIQNGFETGYVAELHDSLNSDLDMESSPESTAECAAASARGYIDEVVLDEVEDLL
jgi:hypothetical protein